MGETRKSAVRERESRTESASITPTNPTETPLTHSVAVRVAGDPDTMNLQEHSNRDDLKVWLSQDEVHSLLDATADAQQRIAIALGVRCGLRSHEVLDVAPEHLVDTDAGIMLRVWHGKGEQFRETPVPQELATTIRTVADVRDAPDSSSLLDVTTTRSLRRWLRTAADQLHDDTGDEGWTQLGFHDLRRTWATALAAADVDPLLVCDWGGWNDLDTFLEHYRGTYNPEAQLRERNKIDWL